MALWKNPLFNKPMTNITSCMLLNRSVRPMRWRRRKNREHQLIFVQQPIDRPPPRQPFTFRDDDGHTLSALVHNKISLTADCVDTHRATRQQRSQQFVSCRLSFRNAIDGHGIGNGTRREYFQSIRKHMQANLETIIWFLQINQRTQK